MATRVYFQQLTTAQLTRFTQPKTIQCQSDYGAGQLMFGHHGGHMGMVVLHQADRNALCIGILLRQSITVAVRLQVDTDLCRGYTIQRRQLLNL
jgi:hypothetical protein